MAVSFEALAMAGADHLDYKVDIEEWERKYVLNPPPYLLFPQSSQKKTFCNHRPLSFYLPKHQKHRKAQVCHRFSSEDETEDCCDDDYDIVKDPRKKGSMVERLKFMGQMVKRMTWKICEFFSITLKIKKKKRKKKVGSNKHRLI